MAALDSADEPTITVKEAVAFLSDTDHPVSESTLGHILSGYPHIRTGRAHQYPIATVLEAHRDWADKQDARRSRRVAALT